MAASSVQQFTKRSRCGPTNATRSVDQDAPLNNARRVAREHRALAPCFPQAQGYLSTAAADPAAAAIRDRRGVAEVLRPAAASLPPDVAPVPLRGLVLLPVPARVLALSPGPGDEIPRRVFPSRPFAK
jgi:hypothetical protein